MGPRSKSSRSVQTPEARLSYEETLAHPQQEWCGRKRYTDGETVTDAKLILFLQEEQFQREVRGGRSKKRQRTNEDGTAIRHTVGASVINNYTSAIISLYHHQHALGSNPHPPPRTKALNALIADREKSESQRKKDEFVDRGIGTMLDGYNQEELRNFVRCCWTGYQKQAKQSPLAVESWLRTGMDFLWGHHTMMRGERRRAGQLADLFALDLKHEGPVGTDCTAMVLLMDNGKTNKFGRLEYVTVVRNKDPLLCTMANVAFYLFYRWDCQHEPVPRFQRSSQWYTKPILKGAKSSVQPLSYQTMLEWVNRVFDIADLRTLKKTHAGRVGGANCADEAGVEDSHIRRAGLWNADSMSKCYLSNISRPFVRAMAGFPPNEAGNYFLPRAQVKPPPSLVRAIWPWVDQWLAWFSKDSEPSPYGPPPLVDGEQDPSNLAAQGHLRLLDKLRTIILQDSVFYRKEFPSHPMWNQPVFQREDYHAFVRQLEAALEVAEPPADIRLRTALPDTHAKLTNMEQNIVQTLVAQYTQGFELMKGVQSQLDDIFSGKVQLISRLAPAPSAGPQLLRTDSVLAPSLPAAAAVPAVSTAAAAAPASAAAATADPDTGASEPSYDAGPSTAAPASRPRLDKDHPPDYRMSRTNSTVYDLWREWSEGLGSNGYAVRELEEMYGPRWRPEQSEKMYFGRRKVIIGEVIRRMQQGKTKDQAIEELEFVRRGLSDNASLDKLSKHLSSQSIGATSSNLAVRKRGFANSMQ